MFRLPQREMDLRTGSTTVVLLADKSGSMPSSAFDTMDEVVPHFRGAIPGLRVFVFHADVREVEFRYPSGNIKSAWACDGITDAEWRREARTGRMIRRNTTYLGAALEAVAGLKPCKTIVFCDGGAADKSRALRAADNITGEIDCYFFPSKMAGYDDVGFMEKLARRGRGRLVRFDGRADMRDELRRSLPIPQPHNPHHGAPSHMRRPIPGGRVDVRAAPDQAHVIYEDIHLFRQRRIHTHHLPDQQIDHGEAESVSVDMAATQVNVQHAEQPISRSSRVLPRLAQGICRQTGECAAHRSPRSRPTARAPQSFCHACIASSANAVDAVFRCPADRTPTGAPVRSPA